MVKYCAQECSETLVAIAACGGSCNMASRLCQSTLCTLRRICAIVAGRTTGSSYGSVIHHRPGKGGVAFGVTTVTRITRGGNVSRSFAHRGSRLAAVTRATGAGCHTRMVKYCTGECSETLVAIVTGCGGDNMACIFT